MAIFNSYVSLPEGIISDQAFIAMKLFLLILQLTLALTAKYRSVSLVPEPTALAASNKSQADHLSQG